MTAGGTGTNIGSRSRRPDSLIGCESARQPGSRNPGARDTADPLRPRATAAPSCLVSTVAHLLPCRLLNRPGRRGHTATARQAWTSLESREGCVAMTDLETLSVKHDSRTVHGRGSRGKFCASRDSSQESSHGYRTPMQLGMIGLGRMGANLMRRLMSDGHHPWRARTPSPPARLATWWRSWRPRAAGSYCLLSSYSPRCRRRRPGCCGATGVVLVVEHHHVGGVRVHRGEGVGDRASRPRAWSRATSSAAVK